MAARQDGDVFQHGLAAIAKARRLDGGSLQDATDVVDHQRCQGFAFDVFSDDQQRTASLGHLFQDRQQVADVADLLVEQQHERVVQLDNLLFRVVDEVRRQVSAVELHAFHDVQLVGQRLAVFHRDHAFLADLVHGFSDALADGFVAVGRDGANLSDFLAGGRRLADLLQFFDGSADSLVDAALQVHRVHAGGNVLHAFAHDRLGQHRCGGGAVTGVVAGLGSHFLDHLRAHVLQLVLQLDFLGDRHTVLGHGRATEAALQHHVTALRAQGHLHCVGENVHAFDHLGTCGVAEHYVFSCHLENLRNLWMLPAPGESAGQAMRNGLLVSQCD